MDRENLHGNDIIWYTCPTSSIISIILIRGDKILRVCANVSKHTRHTNIGAIHCVKHELSIIRLLYDDGGGCCWELDVISRTCVGAWRVYTAVWVETILLLFFVCARVYTYYKYIGNRNRHIRKA